MTQFLPPNLLALFAAREPVPYLPPVDKPPHERKQRGYLGVGAFLGQFELPADTPPPTRVETREERLERRRRERQEQVAYELEREIAVWDPAARPDATSDAFKTLFVARINYDSSESKLRREFEGYGAIKKIALVHDSVNGKPRGYAFIEYEHERDMHSAYKHADGKKIDGRRVLVDVERARTVKGWLPRRLGGGLGGTRRGGPDVNIKHSGREDNERERERYRLEHERDRDRERRPVDPERRRERSRERRRRTRSRSRERERERERSRERRPRRRPSREPEERRRRRSRERERERPDRPDREKDRRTRRKERRDRRDDPAVKEERVKIKEEPVDDYPDYAAQYAAQYTAANVKYENEEDEKKFQPDDNSNGHYDDNQEDGEYEGEDY
ncbi:small ribonucleoprotein particle U1 subunit 70K isoform X2 [Arctopsyche grandis]|uniref:small ribonucleoprotein particle U1 subunit 70K isoform X2 n=1 Tax=Arctopsyche grandis TaxID=121162 RepID=UPI00406D945D